MARKWGATGAGLVRPFELDASRREQLRLEITGKVVDGEISPAFFRALEQAIASFRAGQEIVATSKPAEVRKRLKAALNTGLALNERLNELDDNSRQLLGEVHPGGILELQGRRLGSIIRALAEAQNKAAEYPQKGRLPEHDRLRLARHVANAIKTHLHARPTTTRGGLFESVLALVLEVATARPVEDVHALIRRALKPETP